MAQQRVYAEFSDFRGGESGTMTGKDAPANSFNGTNVVPYIDGSIGPRAGLYDVTPISGQANGVISAMGLCNKDLTADFFYIQGNSVYQWQIGGARSTAYAGTLAVTPTENVDMVSINADRQHYIVVPGDKCYKLDHQAKTVTALTGSPSGRCIAMYGVRLVVGSAAALAGRIQYSGSATDDADVNTWGALNYIVVPGDPQLQIRGLYTMRDYLLIVRRNGEMWRLSGTPGVNDTLRRIIREEPSFAAFQHPRGWVTTDNQFWSIGLTSTAPQVFNGGSQKEISHLGTENIYAGSPSTAWAVDLTENDVIPPQYGAISPSPDSIVFIGQSSGLMRRHGAWSKHAFGQTLVGWTAHHTHGAVLVTDGGAIAAVPHFWWWNTGGDKPPIKGSGIYSRDSVGDASDTAPACSFSTPEWWDKQGRRGLVRSVIISFTEYDTNVAANNNLSVSVTALDKFGAVASSSSAVQSYTAAPSGSTSAGIRRRTEFAFGDQDLGQGFKINISALRGIKIHAILAAVDISEGPPA